MTKFTKISLLLAITIAIIALVLIAAYTPIHWGYFTIVSIVLSLLIWMQKREVKKTLMEEKSQVFSLTSFEEKLQSVFKKIIIISDHETTQNDDKKTNDISSLMMPNIDDYRISMIHQLGVVKYTNISIPFSKAERLINRAISAAVDGYLEEAGHNINEAKKCITITLDEINKKKEI